jgi:hypothetical protein
MPMPAFVELSTVRVRQLLRADDDAYDDWRVNERRPRVGDVGTVVDVLHADGSPDRYVVECVGDDGQTEWLADFVADELEAA